MKQMIYLRFSLLVLFAFLLLPDSGITQISKDAPGLAGPDKHTCKSGEDMFKTLPVTIGPEHKVSGWCYRWDPPEGLSNPFTANPEASPSETRTYVLTITGDDFAYEITDAMTVFVDEITGLTVTPKLCCYKAGDKLTPEMFNITTSPPGIDRQVSFDPPNVPSPFPGLQTQTKTITVSTKCVEWGPPVQQTVQILVVNENIFTTLQVSIGSLTKAIEKVGKALEEISKKSEIPGSPCYPSAPAFTTVLSVSKGTLCCPNKGCAIEQFKASGTVKACAGFGCDFPIPYASLPGFASLNLAVNFNCCLGIGVEYKEKCDGGDVCLKGVSELNLGVGLSGIILHRDIFRATLQGVNYITTPTFEICVPSLKYKFLGPLCYSLDLVGSVTTFKFLTRQVKFTIIPNACFGGTGVIY